MNKIVVLGSLNMDLVVSSPRMPKVGETISGEKINYEFGGKGANQAVACARAKGDVSFIGAIGQDEFGKSIVQNMEDHSIDVDGIKICDDTPTGVATIILANNDNSIVVIGGANDECDCKLVNDYENKIADADIFLTQLEIPMESVLAGLKLAKKHEKTTILNPAPFAVLPSEYYEYIDYITPNETEFELMCEAYDVKGDLASCIKEFADRFNMHVIVTQGDKGSSFVKDGEVKSIKNIKVKVADTTGAGDTYNGILAARLAHGEKLEDAILYAGVGASLSVEGFGAQGGMPSLEMIEDAIKNRM